MSDPAVSQALSLPLWLFDPPHPTDPDRLTLIRGPERIQTAWWQQTIWRDYYVASLTSGARCWAFVDARNQWYLHGYFG
jgi:protein ImuB